MIPNIFLNYLQSSPESKPYRSSDFTETLSLLLFLKSHHIYAACFR